MGRVAGTVMVESVEGGGGDLVEHGGSLGPEEPRPPRPSWRPKGRTRSARAPEPRSTCPPIGREPERSGGRPKAAILLRDAKAEARRKIAALRPLRGRFA